MTESITNTADAVAELGALPMPVGAPATDALTQTFAPVAALREEPHDSLLHHDYRLSRDLPELGGA
ncbi:hypothetical protein AB0M61_01935 [Streptomyces sp. NPDC051642]|uniref:hypothetical protein n=1 Tax=Streptomyces sp. NPDC051642 TaxID=3154646 RepID=UPI003432F207